MKALSDAYARSGLLAMARMVHDNELRVWRTVSEIACAIHGANGFDCTEESDMAELRRGLLALEREGALERERDWRDGRCVKYRLTTVGRKRAGAAQPSARR
jgi:hypothetical protein